jgi:hypothetical protein
MVVAVDAFEPILFDGGYFGPDRRKGAVRYLKYTISQTGEKDDLP